MSEDRPRNPLPPGWTHIEAMSTLWWEGPNGEALSPARPGYFFATDADGDTAEVNIEAVRAYLDAIANDEPTTVGCSGCGVGPEPHGPDCRARKPVDSEWPQPDLGIHPGPKASE